MGSPCFVPFSWKPKEGRRSRECQRTGNTGHTSFNAPTRGRTGIFTWLNFGVKRATNIFRIFQSQVLVVSIGLISASSTKGILSGLRRLLWRTCMANCSDRLKSVDTYLCSACFFKSLSRRELVYGGGKDCFGVVVYICGFWVL